MTRKTPLAFTLVALTLNGVGAFHNSHFWGGDPLQAPRKAVDIATSQSSREYFSPALKIRAPLMTVTASVLSDGPVPAWDVSSGQLLSKS
jgi:hypothetical protein